MCKKKGKTFKCYNEGDTCCYPEDKLIDGHIVCFKLDQVDY